VSWLHIDDFLAVVCLALDDPSMSGIVHGAALYPGTTLGT
jgi:NAD dependent epimerase/dehydratase family enzyme